jgi:hypothetical protein
MRTRLGGEGGRSSPNKQLAISSHDLSKKALIKSIIPNQYLMSNLTALIKNKRPARAFRSPIFYLNKGRIFKAKVGLRSAALNHLHLDTGGGGRKPDGNSRLVQIFYIVYRRHKNVI